MMIFFIKRFPDIKESYDKIKNIENNIMLSEWNFNKMKANRDTLRTTLKFRDDHLSRKEKRFIELQIFILIT